MSFTKQINLCIKNYGKNKRKINTLVLNIFSYRFISKVIRGLFYTKFGSKKKIKLYNKIKLNVLTKREKFNKKYYTKKLKFKNWLVTTQ